MKNLWLQSTIILVLVLTLAVALPFPEYQVRKVEKVAQLNSAYPHQIIKLEFICTRQSCPSLVIHAIPEEYATKVNKISFKKTKDEKEGYAWEVEKYKYINGEAFDLYKIDIGAERVKGDTFILFVQTFFVNRYVNYPRKITLEEDQKFEYEDNKNFVSPYFVRESHVSYKFSKIINFEPNGEKKGISGVTFRNQNYQPFTTQPKHIVHGVNNEPQVVFSEVQRIIEVSHWGNIAISEFYKLKNVGPELEGEFSRIQFSSTNSFEAKNAFRGTQTKLPYQIWGLYYRDQVGNISTSRAYRDHHSKEVRFALTPRYSLLGGWKCNWEIGYNLPTKGFLTNDGNQFSLSNVPIEFAFNKILAQKFTTRVILPEGSLNPVFFIEGTQVKKQNIAEASSFGYLDFIGRPAYIISNIEGNLAGKELEVKYHYDQINIYKKPLMIFGAIFSTMMVIIILKRMNLDTFIEHAKTN